MTHNNNTQPLRINPVMLSWAREQLDLSVAEAAIRIKLKNGKRIGSAENRLREWETGKTTPTVNQLKQIAKAYRRPFITFFLPSPPGQSSILTDFRTIGDHITFHQSPELRALRHRVENLYETLREIEETDPQQPRLDFVGSINIHNGIKKAVSKLNSLFEWTPDSIAKIKTPSELLSSLRSTIEYLGVYVVLIGDLGSHHSRINPEEFRGIAISDKKVSLIVINPNDSKTAQVFSLIHEFVHVLLGETGICNESDEQTEKNQINQRTIERFCNQVAAEFLVPAKTLMKKYQDYTDSYDDEVNDVIVPIAKYFNVSAFVIIRRMKELKLMDEPIYWELYHHFKNQIQMQQNNKNTSQNNGPSKNIVDRYRLGVKLLSTIIGAAEEGTISYPEASRLLNLRRGRFEKVLQ